MPPNPALPMPFRLSLERIGNAGAGQRRLERGPEPVERRADEPDRLRRWRPVTQEVEHLVGDQLERTAGARPLEEAHGTLERRRPRVLGVREERALEVGERRVCDLRVRGRQLLDPTVRETGEIVGRAAQGGEGRPARLVGKRDVDLGATGEGPEQGPLRAGQVLEAVREHLTGLALGLPRARRQPDPVQLALQRALPLALGLLFQRQPALLLLQP